MNTLPNSIQLLLESIKSQQATAVSSNGSTPGGPVSLGQFPLGTQRGNFQIGGSHVPQSSSGQGSQQNQAM